MMDFIEEQAWYLAGRGVTYLQAQRFLEMKEEYKQGKWETGPDNKVVA